LRGGALVVVDSQSGGLAKKAQYLADGGGVIEGGSAEEHDVVGVERHLLNVPPGVQLREDAEGGCASN
jgi:hypothetical protein